MTNRDEIKAAVLAIGSKRWRVMLQEVPPQDGLSVVGTPRIEGVRWSGRMPEHDPGSTEWRTIVKSSPLLGYSVFLNDRLGLIAVLGDGGRDKAVEALVQALSHLSGASTMDLDLHRTAQRVVSSLAPPTGVG